MFDIGSWSHWPWFPEQYIPHGHCYLWQPSLVGLHVVSNLLIAIAYFSIPAMLVYFVRQRQEITYTKVFLLFSGFIAACGVGHLLDVWTLWFPNYWISGVVRALTAFVSCLTAIKLLEWMPQFLALRSPYELEQVNQHLEQEIANRQHAQNVLKRLLEGTAAVTGREFFTALVENLAQALEVRHAFLSEKVLLSSQLKTLAVWSDEAIVASPFELSRLSPCYAVAESGQPQYHPQEVQGCYPQAECLSDMEASCYLGVPLLDSQGRCLGVLCVMHDQPLAQPDEAKAVMTIFAARATAELQRQRAEAAMDKAYTEMGEHVAARTAELQQVNLALTHIAERERATARIIQQMRQSLNLTTIFRATTQELRQATACDRVITYRFNPDWSGDVVAEAVGKGWRSLLAAKNKSIGPWQDNLIQEERCTVRLFSSQEGDIQDTYFQETEGGIYTQSTEYLAVEDIYARGFSDCYIDLLESIQARAYITVPIFSGRQLWGLLICYQNSEPRQWLQDECQMVSRVGAQLGVAIQQAELLKHTQQQARELRAAKKAADRANQAKSDFLASMSHELRTPLNAILGFTQLMYQDGNLSSRHQRYADIVNTSGEHLLGLINNVLEMSKIEAGQLRFQPEPFDLSVLLQEIQDLLGLKARKKGLSMEVIRSPEVPSQVSTDQGKLRQVLLNLLGNSIKFTSSGGIKLTVDLMPPLLTSNGQNSQLIDIQFRVEDTGVGIAPEEIAELFQPFQQTQSGRLLGKGTGLGIPLSRQYVQLMGGDIEVESAVGQGSQFTFSVRAERIDTSDSSLTRLDNYGKVVGLAADQPCYRILVVEDNPVNQLLLQKFLEPLGLEVKTAADGEVAIAVWESWQPHLIWMDMRMPRVDGYEATRQIRQLEAETGRAASVIIAVTATAFEESQPAILAAGCNDMLYKPLKAEDLLEKMRLHLKLEYRYEVERPSSSL